MANTLPDMDDDEEDFFAMLEKGDEQARISKNAHAVVGPREQLTISMPPHHVLHSDTDHEAESPASRSPAPKGPQFLDVLCDFYSKYNFKNLDKVSYLAEKFSFRRWELWEQLSIKYKLSPSESRLLWINFCITQDAVPECARRLFHDHEAVFVPEDSGSMRKAAWRRTLNIDPESDQRDLYDKYVNELAPRTEVAKLTAETSEIVRDVDRTHQELGFFQDSETKITMTQVLTVYTTLNGIKYVQGMNEILGLVFYALRDDSDTFWGFSAIMNQLKDLYTADADSTHDGIYSRIDTLAASVHDYDYKLAKHFTAIDFPLATFAMRWVTTLLAMDITLPDALRVWDVALQSSKSGNLLSFSICLSLAYLLEMSHSIEQSQNDEDCVEIAGHFGKSVNFNVDELVITALSIYAYESVLRGRYTASSDEPVLEALVDAVGSARARVVDIISGTEAVKARDEIMVKVSNAKSLVSDWFGTISAKMPPAPIPDSSELLDGANGQIEPVGAETMDD